MGFVPFSADSRPFGVLRGTPFRLAARIHMEQKRTNGTFLSAGAHRFPGVQTPDSRDLGVRTTFFGSGPLFSGIRGSGPLFWGPGGRIREVRPLRKLVLRLIWEISGSSSSDHRPPLH